MILILSIILIAAVVFCSFNVLFAINIFNVSPWLLVVAVLASIVIEFVIDGLFAFIVSKMPNKWFENKKIYNVSKKEQHFYEKLGIRCWKDKVWELGKLGGFSKAKIENPNDPNYSHKFLIESYKGELDHFLGMIFGFAVVFVFPLKYAWCVGVPVAVVNLFINSLSFMILRYNTPKLQALNKWATRKQDAKK